MRTTPQTAWGADDAAQLEKLRMEAGYDLTTLARMTCLSVAQVVQLERGGESLFYTSAIKALAGRKALIALRQSVVQQQPSQAPVTEPKPAEGPGEAA